VTERIFTPEDFRDALDTPTGSAFSLEPTLQQSAYFRPQARDAKIPGLYLVGAGTHPGASQLFVTNRAARSLIRRQQHPEGP
jgi:phytoene desaturase